MLFVILNLKTMNIGYSDDWQLIEDMQENAGLHPSYNCDIIINDDYNMEVDTNCDIARYAPDFWCVGIYYPELQQMIIRKRAYPRTERIKREIS
jgi:hypothetical protein